MHDVFCACSCLSLVEYFAGYVCGMCSYQGGYDRSSESADMFILHECVSKFARQYEADQSQLLSTLNWWYGTGLS